MVVGHLALLSCSVVATKRLQTPESIGSGMISFSAFAADAAKTHFDAIHLSELGGGSRNAQTVQVTALDVPYQAALRADEVMVLRRVRVVASGAGQADDTAHKPEISQRAERPVHGVERDGGHALTDSPEDRVDIRMSIGRRDLAHDFETLMGEPKAA